MGKILVVDDERGVLQAFNDMLSSMGHEVITASNGNSAIKAVEEQIPDLVVSDLCMPGTNGLDAFRQIRKISPKLPVIIMTGQGTMDTAIEATKLGAFDYHLKPFEPEAMVAAIERGLESVRLMRRAVELNPAVAAGSADAIVGSCPAMQNVFKAIGRVASTDATVLIRGESGTGKELVARAIYQHSLRSEVPMLVVNCAAIPDNLLESELFGHERGSFTGAHARRIGKFEQAQGGTVFLDEIGDISPIVQAKVLRMLQQKTFERVGGNDTIQANVRVLAATNRNLEEAIRDGSFREDLYHRLNVVTIEIPPLRERRSDIPQLVDYFLDRYSRELKIDRPLMSEAALQSICNSDWPGNVRELEHAIYRTLIFNQGYPIQTIDAIHLPETEVGANPTPGDYSPATLAAMIRSYLDHCSGSGAVERFVNDAERLMILEAMHRTAGNQTRAAQLLGLTRPTLHAKLQRYRIDAPKEP